jgi:hypothetical protein
VLLFGAIAPSGGWQSSVVCIEYCSVWLLGLIILNVSVSFENIISFGTTAMPRA